MDDCLESLGDDQFFSTYDCNTGYWQIRIAEEHKTKTAFTFHCGKFQRTRLPFGLCKAPATFQRAFDMILSSTVPPARFFDYFKAIRARHSVLRYTNRSPRLGMAGRRSSDTTFLVGCHFHGQVSENQAHPAKSQARVALY